MVIIKNDDDDDKEKAILTVFISACLCVYTNITKLKCNVLPVALSSLYIFSLLCASQAQTQQNRHECTNSVSIRFQ